MLTKTEGMPVLAEATAAAAPARVVEMALKVVAEVTATTGVRLLERAEGDLPAAGAPLGLDDLWLGLARPPRDPASLEVCARLVRQAWTWTRVAAGAATPSGRLRRDNFLAWLGDKLRAAEEQESSLSLLLVELQDSDPVAGLYGTVEVEERVPVAYNAVERAVRGIDSVYRCDDAMLAVVLPRCDRANAGKVSERLKSSFDEAVASHRRARTLTTELHIYNFPDELAALALAIRPQDIDADEPLGLVKLWTGLIAGTYRASAATYLADGKGRLVRVAALGRFPDEVPRTAEEAFQASTPALVPRPSAGDRTGLFLPVRDDGGTVGVVQVESVRGSFGAAEVEAGKVIARTLGPLLRLLGDTDLGTVSAAAPRRTKYDYDGIIGRSPAMVAVLELLDKVTETDYPVIIQGESGTGKELIARAIHFNGRRADKPLIAENCAALNENLLEAELFGYEKGSFTGAETSRKGLFELADGGTLFLDEVADMKPSMQKDLLRILQEGIVRPVGSKKFLRVDVRIICASNRDLGQLVEEGKFRADLFYRLNVWSLHMPALRERREDIPHLVQHYLERIAEQTQSRPKTLGAGVLEALTTRDWPGNIRELKNEVARMVALGTGDEITLREVSRRPSAEPVRVSTDDILPLSEVERLHILKALRHTGGNRARAAEMLGINKATIYRKLKSYGLET